MIKNNFQIAVVDLMFSEEASVVLVGFNIIDPMNHF
jgi:hypothetical protein